MYISIGLKETSRKFKHRHVNSIASLKGALVNKLIIYIIMRKEKTLIYRLQSKALNKHTN